MKSIIDNVLTFKEMISERIIKLLYYVGLAAIIVSFAINFLRDIARFHIGDILIAIVVFIVSLLLWRVFCELIIIIFRIYGRLGDINTALGGLNSEAPIPGDAALNEVREAAMRARQSVSERTSSGFSSAKSAASKAKGSVSEKAAEIREDVSDLGDRASSQLAEARAKMTKKPTSDSELAAEPVVTPAPKSVIKKTPAKKAAPKKAVAKPGAAKTTSSVKKTVSPKKPVTKKAAPKKRITKKAPPKA